MPAPARIPRLKVGVKLVDDWIDVIVDAIERALNISGSGPISVRRGPQGTQIGLSLDSFMVLAKTGGSGIGAIGAGNVPGNAMVTIYSTDGVSSPVSLYQDKAYNFAPTGVGANVWVILGRVGKIWVVITEFCTGS